MKHGQIRLSLFFRALVGENKKITMLKIHFISTSEGEGKKLNRTVLQFVLYYMYIHTHTHTHMHTLLKLH